jgi:para-nitrobenzyl esterase
VYTPTLESRDGAGLPVLVWIHGGRFTLGAGRDYDGTKLAATGTVVVTINCRLGVLGFLAHPALASRPGGPSGNYGLMDQQAALRWVQGNIRPFGGNPDNVTIAGQSSGGTSVLVHLISPASRGLFHRAIVQSGSFALRQQSLAAAEADGQAFAAKAGCPDQTADCLRRLPAADLVSSFPSAAIPGVVDGAVLQEPIGTALAAGRFARVPILNGINHVPAVATDSARRWRRAAPGRQRTTASAQSGTGAAGLAQGSGRVKPAGLSQTAFHTPRRPMSQTNAPAAGSTRQRVGSGESGPCRHTPRQPRYA